MSISFLLTAFFYLRATFSRYLSLRSSSHTYSLALFLTVFHSVALAFTLSFIRSFSLSFLQTLLFSYFVNAHAHAHAHTYTYVHIFLICTYVQVDVCMCNIDNQPGIIEEAMFRVDPTRIMFLQIDNFD